MKKTGMAKSDAKKLMGKMVAPGVGAFENTPVVALDRREQRKRDQALGLVPFAVKLDGAMVQQLNALAQSRGVAVQELVAELLGKALAD